LRIATTISSSVKSGCSAIRRNKKSACVSSGEMLLPLGLGTMLPVFCRRCVVLIAGAHVEPFQCLASRGTGFDRFHYPTA
jgi:hypothetical protein